MRSGSRKTGQTIVNVPDAKLMKLFVDDEPLLVSTADIPQYERVLDFRAGTLTRELLWRTPAGKQVHVRSTRLVSLVHRHLAMLTIEVTLLDSAAPVVISSQLLNRQDGEDEYHVSSAALGEGLDPRRTRHFDHRVLLPRLHRERLGEAMLGYRCANSGMTLACGYHHIVDTSCAHEVETTATADLAKTVITREGDAGRDDPGRQARVVPLVDRRAGAGAGRPLLAARWRGPATTVRSNCSTSSGSGSTSSGTDPTSSCGATTPRSRPCAGTCSSSRRRAPARRSRASPRRASPAPATRGTTSGTPRSTSCRSSPTRTRRRRDACCGSAGACCRSARKRATELNQVGALYPWRTINGEEASAYYAAGTAQYHINAAVALALKRYLDASGDVEFLAGEGAEILVETARLWEDLGFYSTNGERAFHIHGVTGPDEYTTVVNDNLYTNVMARFNLRYAARVVELLAESNTDAYENLLRRLELDPAEVERWIEAAELDVPALRRGAGHPPAGRLVPASSRRGTSTGTPPEKYPLLLTSTRW